MTNTELLEQKIKDSGLFKKYIAQKLGITPYALANKIENKSEFKTSQISILCELLGIKTLKEKEEIFFANKVD